jgi:hypothetical protein
MKLNRTLCLALNETLDISPTPGLDLLILASSINTRYTTAAVQGCYSKIHRGGR